MIYCNLRNFYGIFNFQINCKFLNELQLEFKHTKNFYGFIFLIKDLAHSLTRRPTAVGKREKLF